MSDPDDQQRRPKVIWAKDQSESKAEDAGPNAWSRPPVLNYASPIRDVEKTHPVGNFIAGFLLGPVVLAVVLLVGGSAADGTGFILALMLHTGVGVWMLLSKRTRMIGLGFLLAIPLAILIVWSICGR